MSSAKVWAAVAVLGLVAGAAQGAGKEKLLSQAEAGDVKAQFELARRHLMGEGGASQDDAEAARWFLRAAEQGDPRAQMNLSTAYAEGRGVEESEGTAVEWLLKAAEQGHPRAMAVLGERFMEGRGVTQNNVLAYVWISRAAAVGSPLAQLRKPGLAAFLSDEEKAAAQVIERIQRDRTRRDIVLEDQ